MPKSRTIKIENEEYEIPTRQAIAVTNLIVAIWDKLGKPQDPFSESGRKLMEVIIATWEDTYPELSKQWYEDRKEYKNEELSIREQVHQHTGRSLASYPMYIYQIMKKVFPNVKLSNRETSMKMVKHYPIFQMANKR